MYSSASLYFPRSSSCILRYQSCFPCFLASSSASSGEAWRHTLMAISTSKSTSRSFVWNINASLHIYKKTRVTIIKENTSDVKTTLWYIYWAMCHIKFNLYGNKLSDTAMFHATICHGCKNPCYLVAQVTKYYLTVPILFSIITADFFLIYKNCVSSHAPSGQQYIKMRSTGHSRTKGPLHRTCFVSPFWCPKFGRWLQGFLEICGPLLHVTWH